jgi:hypothetical protein
VNLFTVLLRLPEFIRDPKTTRELIRGPKRGSEFIRGPVWPVSQFSRGRWQSPDQFSATPWREIDHVFERGGQTVEIWS